jgi:methionyl-tRNA synthetase
VNRYLDGEAPWKAVKQPGGEAVVRRSLAHTSAALRRIAVLLDPFVPGIASEIARRLGAPGARITKGPPLVARLELTAEP